MDKHQLTSIRLISITSIDLDIFLVGTVLHQNDGLGKVAPFKYGIFVLSMLNF